MNPNFKAWLDRLRDPNYGQYKSALRCRANPKAFCCLGHACDVSKLGEWSHGDGYAFGPEPSDRTHGYPPIQVAKWLGIEDHPATKFRGEPTPTWNVNIPVAIAEKHLAKHRPDLDLESFRGSWAHNDYDNDNEGTLYYYASTLNDNSISHPAIADILEEVYQ